ncbi:Swt1 family HEPN domain-containing protein [Gloeocapsa sp. PCC 73106]|uniref:Swt1 family HEPN domain-containing protein n=1 Tax=Gloeocapsa sp. PCC 73106 TaxID=102232 RepID=UPI0002AC81C4|nr:Swt1 family HEPN domain-containing protein [Gloeocapsa sp. PCC 73106]ELR99554.1 putative ATPase (AAA+ superfamily) [Gloeocapsa sp. PCC 73106]
MSISNRERVGRALECLQSGLYPFVAREMKATYGQQWVNVAINCLPENYTQRKSGEEVIKNDVSALLIVMWENWNDVFKKILGKSDRSLVSELREIRNAWAHNDPFSFDDAYRCFDSVSRLLTSVAGDTEVVDKQKQEILRIRFEEQAKRESRRSAVAPTQGQPQLGLKPWREIVTPHPDVASGRYQQAEFAADLWQVYLDEGSDEYRLPNEFFRRTYLTEGLKQLLTNALLRLNGQGGDPVIELQTNFGGGKTHALLALYHFCFGLQGKDLPGLEPIFQATGINEPPQNVNTVVIVGQKIPPGEVTVKADGTRVHTLWGEIAWQLGGKEGYEMLRAADETATNPGDKLKLLFNRYAPCLILIDEWVTYARQLHEQPDLVGGSFDTHFTFAQTLSESAKNADRTFLVVSIPSSDIEVGGDKGKEALNRLKNSIGRVESPWRPASAEESFEIVRRRLFQNLSEPELFIARDAVIKAFAETYRSHPQEFPTECSESKYERRLTEAYPIHPELFDRLYSDWSSLDKFQRTRGVLRLMSKVIHCLWERQDQNLIILPSHIPMDDPQVQSEMTRYLDDHWRPIIEKDVDGPNSLALEQDRLNPTFGRYSASRRVTRTIYLGSAPIIGAANRGLEELRIKLGCVQPGESSSIFVDALRRLSDRATYLYVDGNRYWISTQPNVTRTALDRARQYEEEGYQIEAEIIRRLKLDKARGDFNAVYIAPESSADIPDDPYIGVRLVVLNALCPYHKGASESPALSAATEMISQRGTGPRYYKNTLIFLTCDQTHLENLQKNVAQYLAWDSIVADKDVLNLDFAQTKQATSKQEDCHKVVDIILQNAYRWILIPSQPDPQGPIIWSDSLLSNVNESPILKTSRKLLNDELIVKSYAGTRLREEVLDPYLWRDLNHIDLQRLWEYVAQYLYLPRLKNPAVLLETVKNSINSTLILDNFAYAQAWDEEKECYLGLKVSQLVNPVIDSQNLIVKSEVAMTQLEAEEKIVREIKQDTINTPPASTTPKVVKNPPRRFYGSVEVDPLRLNRDAPAIANEILQHLNSLSGAKVKVTIEIEAEVTEGVPDDVVRTVTENCNTLKFKSQGFEDE